MLDFSFSMPTRIIFGSGAKSILEKELDEQPVSKVLLVYGRNSARRNGSYAEVTELLKVRGIPYLEHPGCEENPDDEFVGVGAGLALSHEVNFILAIGGGSVIDASKAIALLAANNTQDIWAYQKERARLTAPALPLGVVLTTTGTGTEVNGGFVISRRANNEKVVFTSLSTRPRFAYCNPDFTISLPQQVLSDNYTDIIAHLLEQYFSMEETMGIVDAIILEAIHYLLKNTPELHTWKDSYSIRANTMFASTLSLSYLFSCGKKVPWILHYLTHALSSHRPISHGASLRIVIPGWLVWLSENPSYAPRTQKLIEKLALSDANQLGMFFMDHFSSMGCQACTRPSEGEKRQIVDMLSADRDFLSRANLEAHDLRCILDWQHHSCRIDPPLSETGIRTLSMAVARRRPDTVPCSMGKTKIKILIFPLDIDEADNFIRVANALDMETIGASSAMTEPGDKGVSHFVRLPFITDPEFDGALQRTLEQHPVARVYAPHQGVWRHLDTLLKTHPTRFRFELCRPDPFSATQQRFSPHETWAVSALSGSTLTGFAQTLAIRPPLSSACYSALHRQFLNIPGDSDAGKLRALCDIARLLPDGDMLEVGCLYGRSAFALGYLASRYKLGNLICVDPWNTAELTDQGADAAIINAELANTDVDSEKIFRVFLGAVALLENVGYIRKTSETAISDYEAAIRLGALQSDELGCIPIGGQLSLLHIDANHRYDHVRRDVEIWSPYLAAGGWLLLDDYVWAFGDGPHRVGDELLGSPLYDSAFVSGDTLFLRRTEVNE